MNSHHQAHSPQVYLVHGDYYGLPTWCYLLVERVKLPLLLRRPKSYPKTDLTAFGKIVCSGWGKQPPESVVQEIRSQFGE